MKNGIMIGILMVFMVAFSSCQGGLPGRDREPAVGYKTGSQGIVLSFVPNFPRASMYDDEPFNVLLEVRNRGAEDVGFGGDSVYLSGFDPLIISGISTQGKPIPNLEGITQFNSEGGYDTIEFEAEIYPLDRKNIDQYPATILATTCYGYKTTGSENVCIDPNPFSASSERKVCTASAVSYGTQGAPIAISSVEVEATPRTTRFKINIQNVGAGTVYKPGADYLNKCSPYHPRGLEFNEIDKVRLANVEVAGKSIAPSCKPVDNDGHINLINGAGTVFCELGNLGSGPAYSTPLSIELDYGYRSTISKSVQIANTP